MIALGRNPRRFDFFKTLHDEAGPAGYLGQGTHYSVLRAVVFHDAMGTPLWQGRFADFAVIWDEDHDARVMEPIEEIYRRGLLSSFLMFGEHKGVFTAILSDGLLSAVDLPFNPAFLRRVDELELSVRAADCLKNDNIVYIGDLVQKTEGEMVRSPSLGRRSLIEIKEVLERIGLHVGMEVPHWPPENVDDLAKNIDDLTRQFEHLTKQKDRVALLETSINTICRSLSDPWPFKVASLESPGKPIISDEDEKVILYLKTLKMLWRLGIQKLKTRGAQPKFDVVGAVS